MSPSVMTSLIIFTRLQATSGQRLQTVLKSKSFCYGKFTANSLIWELRLQYLKVKKSLLATMQGP